MATKFLASNKLKAGTGQLEPSIGSHSQLTNDHGPNAQDRTVIDTATQSVHKYRSTRIQEELLVLKAHVKRYSKIDRTVVSNDTPDAGD